MAGYLGTKAVLLSTTAASVGGDAAIGGDLTVDTDTLYVDSANNRVGIGNTSPTQALDVTGDIITSGGVYLGGTGSANKLDDYEEGTWTATMTDGTNAVTIDSSADYVKVGKMCFVRFSGYQRNFASITGGDVRVTGFPFTSDGEGAIPIMLDTDNDSENYFVWFQGSGSTHYIKEGRFTDALSGSELEDNNDIYFTGVYHCA